MAYPALRCLLRWTEYVVCGFEVEEDWFHVWLRLQPACPESGVRVRGVSGR